VAITELVTISLTIRVTFSSKAFSRHSVNTLRTCPRALPGAVTYAPSSRNDRSGNAASHLSSGDRGCGGMAGGISVAGLLAFTGFPLRNRH
jgi:hypothetical protein